VLIWIKRTKLGDPSFVHGIQEYDDSMLNTSVAAEIRRKISDFHTHNVSVYDPSGLASLDT
jgi:gamma-glutamyltranspeptidase/glutathione hydrolase